MIKLKKLLQEQNKKSRYEMLMDLIDDELDDDITQLTDQIVGES